VTSPPPSLQARAAVIVPLKRQGVRLLGRLMRRVNADRGPHGEPNGGDPFLEVGRRLRAARESRGLSLRQLAQETRISIAVLEALEKGWRDRLPEPAYMPTMLALLEQHLALERGSLEAALPPRSTRPVRRTLRVRSGRVPLTSIAQFATWQGALLYALLCLLLIYGLNRQQQRLVVQGLLPLRTVAPLPSAAAGTGGARERDRARVLAAYPDLRPLERARLGQGLPLLRLQSAAPAVVRPSSGPVEASTGSPQPAAESRSGQASDSASGGAAPPQQESPAAQDAAEPPPRP